MLVELPGATQTAESWASYTQHPISSVAEGSKLLVRQAESLTLKS